MIGPTDGNLWALSQWEAEQEAYEARFVDCPECDGDGDIDGDECWNCAGTGEVERDDEEPEPVEDDGFVTVYPKLGDKA